MDLLTLESKTAPRVTRTKKSQTTEPVLLAATSKMQLVNKFLRRRWMTLSSQWTIQTIVMLAKTSLQWTPWWVVVTTIKAANFSSSATHLTDNTRSRILEKVMEHSPNFKDPSLLGTVFWSTLENPMLFLTWSIIRMTMKILRIHQVRELVLTSHTNWS